MVPVGWVYVVLRLWALIQLLASVVGAPGSSLRLERRGYSFIWDNSNVSALPRLWSSDPVACITCEYFDKVRRVRSFNYPVVMFTAEWF